MTDMKINYDANKFLTCGFVRRDCIFRVGEKSKRIIEIPSFDSFALKIERIKS